MHQAHPLKTNANVSIYVSHAYNFRISVVQFYSLYQYKISENKIFKKKRLNK